MAHWINFLISFGFAIVGISAWVLIGGWIGLLAFLGLFIMGSVVSSTVFKRLATPNQLREDLEARVKEERFK
ncbi:MAG: hypothetical protein AAF198_06990 [Pseudomonadota bacterium]